jgi:hypothetical protein
MFVDREGVVQVVDREQNFSILMRVSNVFVSRDAVCFKHTLTQSIFDSFWFCFGLFQRSSPSFAHFLFGSFAHFCFVRFFLSFFLSFCLSVCLSVVLSVFQWLLPPALVASLTVVTLTAIIVVIVQFTGKTNSVPGPSPLPPTCTFFCTSSVLQWIQSSKLYNSSKVIVDQPLKSDPV